MPGHAVLIERERSAITLDRGDRARQPRPYDGSRFYRDGSTTSDRVALDEIPEVLRRELSGKVESLGVV